MKLSEYLKQPLDFRVTMGEITPVRVNEQVRRIHTKYPPVEVPEEDPELEEKLINFERRLHSNDWVGYKWRHASDLARGFLCSEYYLDQRWHEIKTVLFETLNDDPNRSFAKACFESYMVTFEQETTLTNELAIALSRVPIEALTTSSIFIEKFDALNPDGLAERVGEFLATNEKPFQALRALGIPSPHMKGLCEIAFVKCLKILEADLDNFQHGAFYKVMNWLVPEHGVKAKLGRISGVHAILQPYVGKTSSKQLVDEISSFLVDNYNDPRVSLLHWSGIDPKLLKIVLGWLTEKSLKAFFDIISRFDGSHMWEPRKRYWTDIFDSGKIDSAWVVLNSEGQRYARDLAKVNDDKSFLSFGSLEYGGEKTCYFIMQIGEATVVEGSHSFALRFFRKDNILKPDLFEKKYNRYGLVSAGANEKITHHPEGTWQNKSNLAIRKFA